MATLLDAIEGRKITGHRPCPRLVVDEDGWRFAASQLSAGHWTLLGLWGDTGAVHMAVLGEDAREIAVVTVPCPHGRFPSVGALHPPAIRPERAVRDLYGLEPVGVPDTRPWLDLGFWDVQHPLGERRDAPPKRAPYPFLPTVGEGLHQIPVGPVHAGIIEPGHFRFTANGETVVRLEQRLGYVHKGIEALMAGASLDTAARLAGRTSGDSTVAYALAFAHAVEAAMNIEVPPRAIYLRALMAEHERLANHFGDIGAICNDASFSLMHAQCGILREKTLRAAQSCFGHRLMMDAVVPGGVHHQLLWRRCWRKSAACSRNSPSSMTIPLRCRTAPPPQEFCAASWHGNSAPAVMSGVLAAAPSMRARCQAIRPTIGSISKFPCSRPVTSTPASGCASARSSRASP
jgi:hypothetical protein